MRNDPDLITSKLPALQFYQLSIPAPQPPHGSYDRGLAAAGKAVFNGAARCATCHVPPIYTEPGWNLHTAAEIGIDDFQAEPLARAPLSDDAARRACSRRDEGRLLSRRPLRQSRARSSITTTGRSRSTWRPGRRRRLIEFLKSL